jgi:hypothetical protein
MKIPALNVSGAALLTSLNDDRSNFTRSFSLLLDLFMDIFLGLIKDKGLKITLLIQDLEASLGKEPIIRCQAPEELLFLWGEV